MDFESLFRVKPKKDQPKKEGGLRDPNIKGEKRIRQFREKLAAAVLVAQARARGEEMGPTEALRRCGYDGKEARTQVRTWAEEIEERARELMVPIESIVIPEDIIPGSHGAASGGGRRQAG